MAIAKGCGYPYTESVDNINELDVKLKQVKKGKGLRLLEIKCALGARTDLGRPTTTALENRDNFMAYLRQKN